MKNTPDAGDPSVTGEPETLHRNRENGNGSDWGNTYFDWISLIKFFLHFY